MKTKLLWALFGWAAVAAIAVLLSACAPIPTPVPTAVPTAIPPTPVPDLGMCGRQMEWDQELGAWADYRLDLGMAFVWESDRVFGVVVDLSGDSNDQGWATAEFLLDCGMSPADVRLFSDSLGEAAAAVARGETEFYYRANGWTATYAVNLDDMVLAIRIDVLGGLSG